VAALDVRWKGKQGPDLTKLSKHLPKGQWWADRRLQEMLAAKAWGQTPSGWDSLSVEDRAEMMAIEWAQGVMRAWEQLTPEQIAMLQMQGETSG